MTAAGDSKKVCSRTADNRRRRGETHKQEDEEEQGKMRGPNEKEQEGGHREDA